MLMLAVTVMIAAIVSTYAGGFSGGAEKSPQSSIRATLELAQNNNNPGSILNTKAVTRLCSAPSMWFYVPVITKPPCLPSDAGSSKVQSFTEVGNSRGSFDTTIKAGDTFFIGGGIMAAVQGCSSGAWS